MLPMAQLWWQAGSRTCTSLHTCSIHLRRGARLPGHAHGLRPLNAAHRQGAVGWRWLARRRWPGGGAAAGEWAAGQRHQRAGAGYGRTALPCCGHGDLSRLRGRHGCAAIPRSTAAVACARQISRNVLKSAVQCEIGRRRAKLRAPWAPPRSAAAGCGGPLLWSSDCQSSLQWAL